MPCTQDRLVMKWMMAFGCLVVLLVVYGGFVRLMRAGLSIVEWNPVGGAIPPWSGQTWEHEFAKYQATPEYQQINRGMSLLEYKEIYLIEWFHRVLARFAGLVFAIPFLILLLIRRIPWREAGLYVVMGILFLSQALMGWLMVSSGLLERPSVSHFLLAAHLFLALSLIGLSVWTALGHLHGFDTAAPRVPWSSASATMLAALMVLLMQIAYGALTAGLKAGHVSDSWPLMLGRLIPAGLLEQVQPPLLNLVASPLTVAFIHRWLGFAASIAAILALVRAHRADFAGKLRGTVALLGELGVLQIGLGIAVVMSRVAIPFALLHQLNAILLFVVFVYLLHRLRIGDRSGLRPSSAVTAV